VAKLQKKINTDLGSSITVDGIYGNQTKSAVYTYINKFASCVDSSVKDGSKWLSSYWTATKSTCTSGDPINNQDGKKYSDQTPDIKKISNSEDSPLKEKTITACYKSTTEAKIIATPSDTYKGSIEKNGCLKIANNEIVRCITGYIKTVTSPYSCNKVDEYESSNPTNQRIVNTRYNPTLSVVKNCGQFDGKTYSTGEFKNTDGSVAISWPNKLTKGCHTQYTVIESTLKRGLSTSPIVSCFNNQYKPYKKFDTENKSVLGYLCIQI
jgi:peptidoglycan hydrolase-like protein with peptidoglycan-binding domain